MTSDLPKEQRPENDNVAHNDELANSDVESSDGIPPLTGKDLGPDLQSNGSAHITERHYTGSVYCSPHKTLPTDFVAGIRALEKNLDAQVWMLVQQGGGQYGSIYPQVSKAFFEARHELDKNRRIALVLESPGGIAQCAYQIASLLRRRTAGFIVVVPSYAKSAATLLSLGADTIIMGEGAELGPLDVQLHDPNREERISALDEVHAIQRLNAAALEAVDHSMQLLLPRTRKKMETLLPLTLNFVSSMMTPLFDKIDTVHYTQMARSLKVAEEYAYRLLMPRYSEDHAKEMARHLVEQYPEHGFIIDIDEAKKIGLQVQQATTEQGAILDVILPHLDMINVIGRLKEVDDNGE